MSASVSVTVESELKNQAQILAKKNGLTLSALMRSLLRQLVASKMSKAEILRMIKENV